MSRITHNSLRFWITSLLATILASHLAAVEASALEQLLEAPAGMQSSQADTRKLEVGKPIEREMKGGESHTYEITLEAGQYVNLVQRHRIK